MIPLKRCRQRLHVDSRWRVQVFGWLIVLVFTDGFGQSPLQQETTDLTLEDYLKRVVERNESIQNRILEVEFNRRRLAAEYGTFEPEAFASAKREAVKRQNTVQEQSSLSGLPVFNERNNIYDGGLEALVPSGARVRLGYTLRELKNNLPISTIPYVPQTNAQYQTFVGLSVTQPLLKNAWYPANLAALRVAALSSDLAYQEYRRQMMVVLATAIASYWELYLAQEQLRFFRESVGTAEKILNDNRARLQAGRGSELEVLQAEAGLALRRSKLGEAEQKLYEAANKVLSLCSMTVVETNRLVHAVDAPQVGDQEFTYFDAWRSALDVNPDYASQRLKLTQEMVRLAYARNQALPELNLKGSYGLNGLGQTPGDSWDAVTRGGYPSWSIGVELRVPLAGGIRARNELRAAHLRYREAVVGLREVETQIANSVDTALHKIRSARETAHSYRSVLDFNQNLLDSALAQLEVGRIESRKILDIEADVLESRNSATEARVHYQRAVLELEMIEGSLLKEHHFDLSQRELQLFTADLARQNQLDGKEYDDFVRNLKWAYEAKEK